MKKNLIWMLFVLPLVPQQVAAFDFESQGMYFNIVPPLDNPAVEITYNPEKYLKGEGSYSGQINIPYEVDYNGATYKVEGIGAGAFKYSQDLTGINWSNSSVSYIAEKAFEGVKNVFLEEMGNYSGEVEYTRLPSSIIEVGERAFAESGLTAFYDHVSHVRYGNGIVYFRSVLADVQL